MDLYHKCHQENEIDNIFKEFLANRKEKSYTFSTYLSTNQKVYIQEKSLFYKLNYSVIVDKVTKEFRVQIDKSSGPRTCRDDTDKDGENDVPFEVLDVIETQMISNTIKKQVDDIFLSFSKDNEQTSYTFPKILTNFESEYVNQKATRYGYKFCQSQKGQVRIEKPKRSICEPEIASTSSLTIIGHVSKKIEDKTNGTSLLEIPDKIKREINEIFIRLQNITHSHTFSRKHCKHREYIEEKVRKQPDLIVTELKEGVLQVKNTNKPNVIKESFYVEPCEKTNNALSDFLQLPIETTPQHLQPRQSFKFSYGPLSFVPLANPSESTVEFQRNLPVYSKRDEILEAINNNRVTIICSDTGSGKTTQIPQYILEYMRNKREKCRILCSEPRRIATVSVAERVASERGETVGKSVGYYIRFEKNFQNDTNLIYAPAGTILKTFDSEFDVLHNITHIILDEVHERDELSDFLMLSLKMALSKLPHLKLILMSATMNTTKFQHYFNSATVLSIPGRGHTIKFNYLSKPRKEQVPEEHREVLDALMDDYRENEDSFSELMKYFVRELTWIDYQHSKTGMTALMIAAALGDCNAVDTLLHLNADRKLTCKNGNTCLDYAYQSGRKRMINILIELREVVDALPVQIFVKIVGTIEMIVNESQEGSILVFLPGYAEIMICDDLIKKSTLHPMSYKIFYLHGSMTMKGQTDVFKPLNGIRKIILATNVAESGITIDGVDFVIDCCKARQNFYDPVTRASNLKLVWISKQNAIQRAGRTGRTGPGQCFRLCTKEEYESLEDGRSPEILQIPLESLCLFSKVFAPSDMRIEEYLSKALDPPDLQSIQIAVENLKMSGALDPNEELTDLGKCLTQLSVEPRLGKMLIYGAIFKCLGPILTLVAILSYKSPFDIPPNIEHYREINLIRNLLVEGIPSSELEFIKVFNIWENARRPMEVCKKYCLSSFTMDFVSNIRKQLLNQLGTLGFFPGSMSELNKFGECWPMVKAVIGTGYYPYIGCPVDEKSFRTKQIKFDENSALFDDENKKGLWALYYSLSSNRYNQFFLIRGSLITPLTVPLMLMGGKSWRAENTNGNVSYLQTDDWLTIETNNEDVFKFNQSIVGFINNNIKYGPQWSRYGEDLLNTLDLILRAEDESMELVQPDGLNSNMPNVSMDPAVVHDEEQEVYMLIKPKIVQHLTDAYSGDKIVIQRPTAKTIEKLVMSGKTVILVFGMDSHKSFNAVGKYVEMERKGSQFVAKIQWLFKNKVIPYHFIEIMNIWLNKNRTRYVSDGTDGELMDNRPAQRLVRLFEQTLIR